MRNPNRLMAGLIFAGGVLAAGGCSVLNRAPGTSFEQALVQDSAEVELATRLVGVSRVRASG